MSQRVDGDDDDDDASDTEAFIVAHAVGPAGDGPEVENCASDEDDDEDDGDDFFGLDYDLIEEFSQINVNFACCRELCVYAFELQHPGVVDQFRERRETFRLSVKRRDGGETPEALR